MEEKRLCPECGENVGADIDICPECGCPLKSASNKPDSPKTQSSVKTTGNKRNIGIVMCVAALLCIVLGITRITNDRYQFYAEHLEDCLEAYGEVKAVAKRSSGWLSYSYDGIAEGYEDMIAEDRLELWKYRIQAIGGCGAGAALLYFGIPKVKRGGEDDGANQMS